MYPRPLFAVLAVQCLAAPTQFPSHDNNMIESRQASPVLPQLKRATIIANVTQPSIDRDSCGSSRIGNRAFWTCRDTMRYDAKSGKGVLPLAASSGGWSDLTSTGPLISKSKNPVGVASSGSNPIHLMYGTDPSDLQPYFPFQTDSCPTNGVCNDGTRYVVWPNQPPLITESSSTRAVGYSWIAKERLNGLNLLNPQPAYSLYKLTWSSSSPKTSLPTISTINSNFWKPHEFGYGHYGSVIRNGYAYLYAQLPETGGTILARVPTWAITTRSAYRYFVDGKWTTTMPTTTTIDDNNKSRIIIPNAGTGWQGTFYYSSAFSSYVWIGQQILSPVADFWITTAPAPEGPWVAPWKLWSGPNGDGFVGGYSLQAHPGLLEGRGTGERGIYVSYTQQWEGGDVC